MKMSFDSLSGIESSVGSAGERVIAALLLLSICLLGCENIELANSGDQPPNVVVILADDMGWGDPGSFNPASKIPTPSIDKLAIEGMRFTDAHSPSSVCTPTRYGILMGRYAWRTHMEFGVTLGYSKLFPDTSRTSIADVFQQAGYSTGGVGKWHLGLGSEEPLDYSKPLSPGPRDLGFDYWYGIPASLDMEPYLYFHNENAVELPTESIDDSMPCCTGAFFRGGPIAPSFRHIDVLPVTVQKAQSFIEENSEKPFFLYVAFASPHTPWLPTADFRGNSEAGEYGDFVAQTDHGIGQILSTLESTGVDDNTLVIFASDNGPFWRTQEKEEFGHHSQGNWRGMKADIWEGGHRVPFIAKWPNKIEASTTSAHPISLVDVMRTAASAADLELPNESGPDSFDLTPVFKGQGDSGRESLIMQSSKGMYAIRQGEWKLIFGIGSGGFTQSDPLTEKNVTLEGQGGQLYNLSEDPGESNNLYSDHPEIVQRLTKLFDLHKNSDTSR